MRISHFTRSYIQRFQKADDGGASISGGASTPNAILNLVSAALEKPAAPTVQPSDSTEVVIEPGQPATLPTPIEKPAADWRDSLPAEAKAHIAELESKLKSPAPAPATPATPDPKPSAPTVLADVRNDADLAAFEQRTEAIRDWALENINGTTVTAEDGTETEYTAQQMAKIFAEQDKLLRRGIPSHAAQLAAEANAATERERITTEAKKHYTWLDKPESPEAQMHANLMKHLPAVAQIPAGVILLADAVAGFHVRSGKTPPAPAAAPVVQPPAPAPKPPVIPASSPAGGGKGGGSYAEGLKAMATAGGAKSSVVAFLEGIYSGQ